MAYFTRETLRFLSELEKHNERAWFEKNKARYEARVKEPSGRLIADAAPRLGMDGKAMRDLPRRALLEGQVALQDERRHRLPARGRAEGAAPGRPRYIDVPR